VVALDVGKSVVARDADTVSSVAAEPRWLRALAFVPAALVASFGGVGLVLAVAGVYRPLLAFPLGAACLLALLLGARPLLVDTAVNSRRDHAIAAVALVFVVAMGAWHAKDRSEHVLINRDPGSYANTGRWLASHGDLTLDPRVGPFADEESLEFRSFGVYDRDGKLTFQFAHLLPVLLAEVHRIGGDRLMFAAPGLLSAAALLAFFIAAWRFLRQPLIALGALVAFAFLMPSFMFSRDTYSEVPTQVLLFTGLWILLDRVNLARPRAAFVAGLLLGMLQAVRVDAFVLLVGVPLVFAFAFVWRERPRRDIVRSALACAAGTVPGIVLGFTDLALRSPQYLSDLGSEVKQLVAVTSASLIGSAALMFVATRWSRWKGPQLGTRARRLLGTIGAVAVLAAGLLAWFVRPEVQTVRGSEVGLIAGLQTAANVAVDPTRLYFERSMEWMSWYLGALALAAAIVGAALLVNAIVRGNERSSFALLGMLGPASVLYLWKANAAPDHIWVMRRFIVCALPLLVLLAFWLVAFLTRIAIPRVWRGIAMATAVVIGVAAITAPIAFVVDVRRATEQRGFLAVVTDACGVIGSDGAVVVLQDATGIVHEWIPQTLRSWCDVPVARLPKNAPDSADTLRVLASKWAAEDRRLFVVAGAAETIAQLLPDARPVATRIVANPHLLEQTLLRRPERYAGQAFALALAEVPPG
jgi:hypothetical protein